MVFKNTKVIIFAAVIVGFILGVGLTYKLCLDQFTRQAKLAVLLSVLGQSKQVQLLAEVSNGLNKRSSGQTKKYLCASMKVSISVMNEAKNQFVESVKWSINEKKILEGMDILFADLTIAEHAMQSAQCVSE